MVVRGTTRITRKGQITVPAAIRAALALKEGDRLELRYDETTNTLTVESAHSVIERTRGMLKSPVKYSVEEEKRLSRESRAKHAAEKYAKLR